MSDPYRGTDPATLQDDVERLSEQLRLTRADFEPCDGCQCDCVENDMHICGGDRLCAQCAAEYSKRTDPQGGR